MWIGVTSGLAFRKFSGSVNRFGANRTSAKKNSNAMVYPSISLME
jgi:hypothetical protein